MTAHVNFKQEGQHTIYVDALTIDFEVDCKQRNLGEICASILTFAEL